MFKALNIHDDAEVVIIEPKWQRDIEALRAMDRQDFLVCQGCRKPVRVRAGHERRHHFAHKHLLNCSYTDESAILRDARAVLYEWLCTKFGESVSIEKKLEDNCLFRPVDCWVDQGNKAFAYWIFDSPLNPEKREKIKSSLGMQKLEVNYVFSSEMLRRDSDRSGCIHLSTTEREFQQRSAYDEVSMFPSTTGQSLHYLDANQRKIITFRSLNIIHRPQVFKGSEISSELSNLLVSPRNGEFVHPGEPERQGQYQLEQAEAERRRREALERRTAIMSTLQRTSNHRSEPPMASPVTHKTDREASSSHPLEKQGVCIFCGVTTTDWWTHDGVTGQCKCKSCLRQGRS